MDKNDQYKSLTDHEYKYARLSPYWGEDESDSDITPKFPVFEITNPEHREIVESFSIKGRIPIRVTGLGSIERERTQDMLTVKVEFDDGEVVYARLSPNITIEDGEVSEKSRIALIRHNIETAYFMFGETIDQGRMGIPEIKGIEDVEGKTVMLESVITNGGTSLDRIIGDSAMERIMEEVELKLNKAVNTEMSPEVRSQIAREEFLKMLGKTNEEKRRFIQDKIIFQRHAMGQPTLSEQRMNVVVQSWIDAFSDFETHFEMLDKIKAFLDRGIDSISEELAFSLITISVFGRDGDGEWRNMLISDSGKFSFIDIHEHYSLKKADTSEVYYNSDQPTAQYFDQEMGNLYVLFAKFYHKLNKDIGYVNPELLPYLEDHEKFMDLLFEKTKIAIQRMFDRGLLELKNFINDFDRLNLFLGKETLEMVIFGFYDLSQICGIEIEFEEYLTILNLPEHLIKTVRTLANED